MSLNALIHPQLKNIQVQVLDRPQELINDKKDENFEERAKKIIEEKMKDREEKHQEKSKFWRKRCLCLIP